MTLTTCLFDEVFLAYHCSPGVGDLWVVSTGVVLASSYEFPGRYARWTLGFIDPPLKIEARSRSFTISALNDRGLVLLAAINDALSKSDTPMSLQLEGSQLQGEVRQKLCLEIEPSHQKLYFC